MQHPNRLFERPLTDAQVAGMRLIGESLRRARRDRGWTQFQLEQISGVDQTIISRLENGRLSGLALRKLAALAHALHGSGRFPLG